MKTFLTSLLFVFFIQNGFSAKTTGASSLKNIDLISFNLAAHNEQIEVSWESNVYSESCLFIVERSDNAVVFNAIDTVIGKEGHENYKSSDETPFDGLSYYRLKCVHIAGEEITSEISYIEFNAKPKNAAFEVTGLFPVPFAQNLNLSVKCKYAMLLKIRLTDLNGKLIYETTKECTTGYNNFEFSEIVELKNDTYYMTLSDENMNIKTLYVAKHNDR